MERLRVQDGGWSTTFTSDQSKSTAKVSENLCFAELLTSWFLLLPCFARGSH